jgi:polyhydroxybutyrate depolymerase
MAAALIVACAFRLSADDTGDAHSTLDVGGITRTYVVHVPTKLPPSAPLVLSFHGHFSTGEQQSLLTHFDSLSNRYGFIIVYPDGIDRSWNDGRVQDKGADDIAFVKALIGDFAGRYHIDPKRIYATGFSNGATFSQYLGCFMADQIAAIAPVSGYMPVDDVAGCRPSRPISVLEIGGTADPIEPYKGGEVRIGYLDRGAVLSAEDSLAIWRKNAGCPASAAVAPLKPIGPVSGGPGPGARGSPEPADGTRVMTATYAPCHARTGVVLYTVVGGGHAWPGGPQYFPRAFIGTASQTFDASQAIVDFFYAHPRQ